VHPPTTALAPAPRINPQHLATLGHAVTADGGLAFTDAKGGVHVWEIAGERVTCAAPEGAVLR
jgi:hypothetical protein